MRAINRLFRGFGKMHFVRKTVDKYFVISYFHIVDNASVFLEPLSKCLTFT